MCMSSLRSVLILSVAPRFKHCKLLNVDELEPPARAPARTPETQSGDSTYEDCAGDDVSMYNP